MIQSVAIRRLTDALATAVLPPPALLVSDWARKNFRLSSDYSAVTGNFEPYPYQTEPLDVLSPSNPADMMALMCGAQMMKTIIAMIFLGYVIDNDPGPVLIVQPSVMTRRRSLLKLRSTFEVGFRDSEFRVLSSLVVSCQVLSRLAKSCRVVSCRGNMVRMRGLEPPHPCGYMDLNHARLPIPPHPQNSHKIRDSGAN